MSAGIKIRLPIEYEEHELEIYPDLSVEFTDYDIEHDIVLAELGEEPSDAFLFSEKYENYGILLLAMDEDLYESFLDNIDAIKKLSKKDKSLWVNQICKKFEPILSERLYGEDEIISMHHIIDLLSEGFYINGSGYYIESISELCMNINGTLLVEINDKICSEVEINFYAGYENLSPAEPELIITDHNYDEEDLSNNIKNLYEAIYGFSYESSREFNINEPYKNDKRFKDFNPLEGYDSGRWALVIKEEYGSEILFSAIYKTKKQLDDSLKYISAWFIVVQHGYDSDIHEYIACPYEDKDEKPGYEVEVDEWGDPEGLVTGGWEEVE